MYIHTHTHTHTHIHTGITLMAPLSMGFSRQEYWRWVSNEQCLRITHSGRTGNSEKGSYWKKWKWVGINDYLPSLMPLCLCLVPAWAWNAPLTWKVSSWPDHMTNSYFPLKTQIKSPISVKPGRGNHFVLFGPFHTSLCWIVNTAL